MFTRFFARLAVLAIVFGLLGLAVGLVGKYALDMSAFANPFWAMAGGIAVGALLSIPISARIESRRSKPGR